MERGACAKMQSKKLFHLSYRRIHTTNQKHASSLGLVGSASPLHVSAAPGHTASGKVV